MIDIQTVACFNTRSPILHLVLPIQCQIHNKRSDVTDLEEYAYREKRY